MESLQQETQSRSPLVLSAHAHRLGAGAQVHTAPQQAWRPNERELLCRWVKREGVRSTRKEEVCPWARRRVGGWTGSTQCYGPGVFSP